jgi:pyruvate formate lyase activating enzyme
MSQCRTAGSRGAPAPWAGAAPADAAPADAAPADAAPADAAPAEKGPQWSAAVLASAPPAPVGADRRVRCELCPYRCTLPEGRVGACKVRRNRAGVLQTATHAVAVSHLDPIERKPLYHVWPGTRVLTVAAPGCTFRCAYCVNHRLSQYGRLPTAGWVGEPADPAAVVALAGAHGAAIGMSYGEPGLAPELTLALAELAAPAGIPLVWKTNGFLTPAAVDLVAPWLSAVNIDVKAADEAAHRRLTGAPLAPVLRALERFRANGVWVEVSTPLAPGAAQSPAQLRAIADQLVQVDRDIPWHLLRFTPDHRMRDAAPSTPRALHQAAQIGRAAGLRFVYFQGAPDGAGQSTPCPHCGTTLLRRAGSPPHSNRLLAGSCPSCANSVPGVWL